MTRFWRIALFSVAIVLLFGAPLLAQTEWPDYDSGLSDSNAINRGGGFYLAIHKIVLILILFWIWVRCCDWVNRDCKYVGMDFRKWTPIVVFPFIFTLMFIVFTIPFFFLSFPLLLISLAAPFGVYVWIRNASQPEHNKVFTKDHLQHIFTKKAGKAGVKVKEKKMAYEQGPNVNFIPAGDDQGNLIVARQNAAFIPTKELFATMLDSYASRFVLDYTKEAVGVKAEVDGVIEARDAMAREVGDPILEIIKTLAGLDPKERRAKQEGEMVVDYGGKKLRTSVVSQGTQTGERAIVSFLQTHVTFDTLADLGMREKMIEKVRSLAGSDGGLFLISSMPRGGQSSTLSTILRNTDRLLRDFVIVEDEQSPEPDVENVDPNKYDSAKGETPATILPSLMRKMPDAYVVPDIVNGEALKMLLEEINEEGKLVIMCIRAKDAAEAIIRLLMLKQSQKSVAKALRGVLNVRLIRKLNEPCKEPYEPSEQLLKALGIPAGRIDTLYRERTLTGEEDPKKDPCAACGGRPYQGRTAIFELLEVDDKIREVIIKQPKVEVLRKVAKANGHRGLQEEGAVLVAQGVTSVKELKRVLES